MRQKTIILNSIAKSMNAGGSAIVSAYDAGAAAFNCTMSALSPGEKTKLGGRIKTCETKIRALQIEIAKESTKFPDPPAALRSETVKAIVASIKEFTAQIDYMKKRIAELDRIKAVNKPQQESTGVSNFIAHSLSGLIPGEKASRQHKILANEKKIQELYCEFAKEAAKHPDPQAAINSEVFSGIFLKINALKAENDSLKQGNTGLSEKKVEKPQQVEKPKPVDKKTQPESTGVAKFFMHAISDSISKYLPIQKPRCDESANVKESDAGNAKEPAPESVKVPVPESNEQTDVTSIGYDRTKSFQISTPTMQPPTREDIEKVTRVMQAGAIPDEEIDAIAATTNVENTFDEKNRLIAIVEETPGSKEAEIFPQENPETLLEPDADSSPDDSAEKADDNVKSEESSHSDELVNGAMEELALKALAVEYNSIVLSAVYEEPIHIAEESEREVASLPENTNFDTEDEGRGNSEEIGTFSQGETEASSVNVEFSSTDVIETPDEHAAYKGTTDSNTVSNSTMDETLSEALGVETTPTVAVELDETIETSGESINEADLTPENIKFIIEESFLQNDNPGIAVMPMHGFENTRTRSQATSFAVSEYPSPSSPATTIGNDSAFRDGTGPVFRTRVHQNSASIISGASETISTEANVVPSNEAFKVKKYTHLQQNTVPELPTESAHAFRAKLLQPSAPIVKTVTKISTKEIRVKNIKTSIAQKPGSPQKQAGGNATSQHKKGSVGSVGNKKSLLPKGKDGSFKTGKSLPKKGK